MIGRNDRLGRKPTPMNLLIALGLNLAGMLLIYSLMAFALVRLSWHRRGTIAVLAAIIAAGQFWNVSALLVVHSSSAGPATYSLWFCNWLVSAFAVVILCQTAKGIPRQLEDSARLDGCGWFGIYWHVLLPLVKRELGIIAFLTVIAPSVHFLTPITIVEGWIMIPPPPNGLAELPLENSDILMATAFSLLITLPIIAIFLFAKRYLQHTTDAGETRPVPSTC
jgi:multiple sugar transport system permease protein